jgi:hypothetical protein
MLKDSFLTLFDAAYVFAPIYGFIPQIYSNSINYNPILSLLTIFANILKLFPSKNVSSVLIYQFIFCIFVHFYLIRSQITKKATNKDISGNVKERNKNVIENSILEYSNQIIPNFRSIYRYIIFSTFSFVILLSVLDNLKYSYLFLKAALLIETAVSILHIKLLDRKRSIKLLSFVLLLGDCIKTALFYFKFSAPKELIVATLIQLSVNVYLLVQ